jgi:Tol biopolymer transport system component
MAVGTFNGTMDRGILLDVESGDVEALPDRPLGQQFSDWSRDGFLVGTEEGASERPDLLVVPVAQPDSAFRLVRTPFSEGNPRVSPDGRWVAFVSDESGQDEIHVRAFPDGSNPSQLTRGGALAPAWSPDGRQLFYARVVLGLPDDTIMVADFDPAGPTLSGDRPVIALDHWAFDVLPDGGLVVAEGVSEEALSAARGLERSIVVIVNWLESVRDILPD